jgi:hypothetical protein
MGRVGAGVSWSDFPEELTMFLLQKKGQNTAVARPFEKLIS